MAEDDVNLVGTLEKIVYSNPENGFLIGTFLTENSTRPITVKGIVFNTRERETLRLKGNWENHKVYGRQFSIREFMPVEPTSAEGMVRYLLLKFLKELVKKRLSISSINLAKTPSKLLTVHLNYCQK